MRGEQGKKVSHQMLNLLMCCMLLGCGEAESKNTDAYYLVLDRLSAIHGPSVFYFLPNGLSSKTDGHTLLQLYSECLIAGCHIGLRADADEYLTSIVLEFCLFQEESQIQSEAVIHLFYASEENYPTIPHSCKAHFELYPRGEMHEERRGQ